MRKAILLFTISLFISICFISTVTCSTNTTLSLESTNYSTLHTLLTGLIESHEEIKNYQAQVKQAEEKYSKSKGLYYPSMDFRANGGRELIEKEFGADTEENRYQLSLRGNQLITDFGKTANKIARAGLQLEQAKTKFEATKQKLILEGIKAYLNLIRSREKLKSTQLSEDRIKTLTGVEETLVERGAGLSSDVLQAKSQLAGAMAKNIEAAGDLKLAKNRFQTLFFFIPTDAQINGYPDILVPNDKIPVSLNDAIGQAKEQNPELLVSRYNARIAKSDVNISKTEFYPNLNIYGEAIRKENDDGVLGYRNEYAAGLELRYNIFNGGSDRAELRSAVANKSAKNSALTYARRQIEEQVTSAWENLSTLDMKNELLEQQASIVESFLELAKKERKMGTRSLLDVLNGEINYINALATAISARQDTKIAAFNLFYAMGSISLELFE